ncbi:MAG: hypothetical protein WCD42_07640 [Rhizomicrobium sp.]
MPSSPYQPQRPIARSLLLALLGIFLFVCLSVLVGYSLFSTVRSILPNMHFNVSNTADVADIGLPVYTGATARQNDNDDDDNDDAHISAMFGKAGMKVVVANFASADTAQNVAAFYRQSLGQYGPVYDCSADSQFGAGADDDDDNDRRTGGGQLDCRGDHSDGIVLKSGTKRDQHIVTIKPAKDGKGSTFALVYVRIQGLKDN